MAVSPTFPGVYVQEVPSGVRTIVGVGTSIGMFIGTSKKGPINKPIRCLNYTEFKDRFGDDFNAGELTAYVRLFFLNGGTDCYAMRIANGATRAAIDLRNEAGTATLRLTAKDAGVLGNNLRAVVTYSGPQPEVTFNLELFYWEIDSTGKRTKQGIESWKNLSMDPTSPAYAVDFLTQNSPLVDATSLGVAPLAAGFSLSGRGISAVNLGALLATRNKFKLSVDGSPFLDIDLSGVAATAAAFTTEINNTFVA